MFLFFSDNRLRGGGKDTWCLFFEFEYSCAVDWRNWTFKQNWFQSRRFAIPIKILAGNLRFNADMRFTHGRGRGPASRRPNQAKRPVVFHPIIAPAIFVLARACLTSWRATHNFWRLCSRFWKFFGISSCWDDSAFLWHWLQAHRARPTSRAGLFPRNVICFC